MTAVSDRELLELAAKAIGLDGYEWDENPFDRGLYKRNFEDCGLELQTQSFNPLDVDGDALRLASLLGMTLGCYSRAVHSQASAPGLDMVKVKNAGSPMQALRRAVVMLAAEIGKAMP